jgi:hypothetical protein
MAASGTGHWRAGQAGHLASGASLSLCQHLAHEVVYQNLLLRRRTALHQRAGTVLEGLLGTRPSRLEDLEALCHHFSRSEDQARGARYLAAAGDWARGIYANEDALRYYARALTLLRNGGSPDDQAVAGIHEHMGDLLGPIGRRAEAHAQYDAVVTLARATHDPVREGRAQRKLAGLHWDAGERDRSLDCVREGLRLLECRVEAVGSDIAPTSSWRMSSTKWDGSCSEVATAAVPRCGPAAPCCKPRSRQSVPGTIRPCAGPPPWQSHTRSIRSEPRSPDLDVRPKRLKG